MGGWTHPTTDRRLCGHVGGYSTPHRPPAQGPAAWVPLRRSSRLAGDPNGAATGRLTLATHQREAFRAALRTGLALAIRRTLPHRLYSGRLLLAPPSLPAWPDRPLLLHPWSLGEAVSSRKLLRLVGDSAWKELLRAEPITCLAGSAEGILRIAELVLEEGEDLSSVWPNLSLVLCLQGDSSAPDPALPPVLGPHPKLLRAVSCLDGLVALTDPRHGRLRLLTDHGIYFEFIPEDQRTRVYPQRLDLSQVPCGVPHELVLTTPLGVWACRTDLVLTLDRLDPPLLAAVERRPGIAPTAISTSPFASLAQSETKKPAAPAQPPGSASLAGTSELRLPKSVSPTDPGSWSAPVDRGCR